MGDKSSINHYTKKTKKSKNSSHKINPSEIIATHGLN